MNRPGKALPKTHKWKKCAKCGHQTPVPVYASGKRSCARCGTVS